MYGVGDIYRDEVYTVDSDGAIATASSVDAAVLVVNGSDTAASVTPDTATAGVIKVSCSLAGRSVGDDVWVRLTATVDGVQQIIRTRTERIAFAAALASPILTSGTGAGQVTVTSGKVTVGTNDDKTGYSLAANQHVIVDSGTVTTLTNLPAAPTDWLTAAAVKADAVTKIQTGLSTLTAAQVNAEADQALVDYGAVTAADLEAITEYTPAEQAADLLTNGIAAQATLSTVAGYIDTEVAAIKAKTDNLPASPAAVGSAMTLATGAITAAVIATDAIDADALATDAVTEIQTGLATSANQTTILARLGDFAGSGLNTVKGFLRALANKASALTPSELSTGGTFDNTTDSLEAVRDNQSTPPTAAAVADAVWDEALSEHATAGSAGAALTTASQASGVTIDQIVNALGANDLTIISAIANGTVTLYKGDSYGTAGQTLTFTKPSGAVWPSDLSGYTVTLHMWQTHDADNNPPASPSKLGASGAGVAGTVTVPTGDSQAVRIDLTTTQTDALEPGIYGFALRAVSGSTTKTLMSGGGRVIDDDPTD
jgi:hypothetical protein